MKKHLAKENQILTLIQTFDQENEEFLKRVGKDRSRRSYEIKVRARNYVADFLLAWEDRDDIPLSSLHLDFIKRFSVYLSTDRGLRGGTIWLNCMLLKGIVFNAHRRGWIDRNPFAEFNIAKNIRERLYLSEEELQLLIKHPFSSSLHMYIRDLFVFSALTGMSYVDINKLKKSEIYTIDGCEWIISSRQKTGIPFKVRLLPTAQKIINQYTTSDKDLIFNRHGYFTIAKRLSSVLQECGINKHITFHCARHTFAIMALNNGMPIESVSRILGHSNIRTTQIYARVSMKKLDADFSHLEDNLKSRMSKKRGSWMPFNVDKTILSLLHLLAKKWENCKQNLQKTQKKQESIKKSQ